MLSDCCNWEGVNCSDVTGRVVELHLSDLGNFFSLYDTDYSADWSLNFSILLPLENLQAVDLSNNYFGSSGLVGCERLANFRSLEFLNLDNNRLENNTFQCLATISSLKHLSLASNNLDGLFPLKEINRLKQLEHLDLRSNLFDGSLSFKDLKLPHLELLNLRNTFMRELSSLEVMTSLRVLSLSRNHINDSSILRGICSLKYLVELDVRQNDFSGKVPLCFSNLTALALLDISDNNFSGNVPSSVITNLINLEYLSLSGNQFEGSFSLSSFANHSKLKVLLLEPDLGSKLYVTSEDLAFSSSFQLRALYLVGCNLNNETRQVPNFLFYQTELRALDLSSNNLVGEFPNWLLENNTHLKLLNLGNNSFTGLLLPRGTPKLQDLLTLDISNNEVGGQVPQDIGLFFSSLVFLNFSRNYFQGSIPESLSNMTVARSFDLSHNNFSGEVPYQIETWCVGLHVLLLSNNSLRGHFPSSAMNLTSLRVLRLDNNNFSGSISRGLSCSLDLNVLDMSKNEFQGEILSWIGNLSLLETLDLSWNQLEGTIPHDICNLGFLEFLDLSKNHLNGSIPSCSGFSSLRYINLQRNQISGSIPNALFGSAEWLEALDLSHNYISGGFPPDIGTFTELWVLLLGGNNLQGKIPASICQLKELSILDLSHNKFYGQIPSCLNNLTFGKRLLYSLVSDFNTGIHLDLSTPPWGLDHLYISSLSLLIGDDLIPKLQEIVEFTTKSITYVYTDSILNYMSGLDLSSNQLTGQIPIELGDLRDIRALNLSHNYLERSIPSELSMLNVIESLDLSYNNLSGQIPYELTNLHFLSHFNVSYNNLSGRAPDKGQFANFDDSNYRGNPNLCGPLLRRHCESITGTVDPKHSVGREENDGANYTVEFFLSFSVSFAVVLVTLALSLYLSPGYRGVWSRLIDTWILSRFYLRYKSRSK